MTTASERSAPEPHGFVTVTEIAAMSASRGRRLTRLFDGRELPSTRTGTSLRVPLDAVEDFLRNSSPPGSTPDLHTHSHYQHHQ